MPHLENYYNKLELFNESLIALIVYSLIGFVSTGITPLLVLEVQWVLGYVSMMLIAIVYMVNFGVMVRKIADRINWVIKKIKAYFAKKKLKKVL